MVDFQSREPRTRGDDEDSDEGEPEADAGEAQAETERAKQSEPGGEPLSYAVVTVTGTRSLSEDTQGDTAVEIIEDAGGTVTTRDLINATYDGVQSTITTLTKRDDVDAVVTIGGTGVEPSDVTIEAVDRLFDKRLPGFGELFRRQAYDDHGTGIIGTRTAAGVIAGTPVFSIPGTIDGVVLATEDIIVEEAESLAEAAGVPQEDADEESRQQS